MIGRRGALGLALAAPVAAPAQQFLYDPEPPAGSAFLRFVHAGPGTLILRPDFDVVRTMTAEARVSPYVVVERVGGRSLALDGQRITLAAGSFNTLIVTPAGQRLVTDQAEFNQLRARLTFYNATADCADATLALAPGGQQVFQSLAPGEGRSRAVNPAAARLRASCAGAEAPEFALEGLVAGGMYSIWLMRPAGDVLGFMTRDTTERRR